MKAWILPLKYEGPLISELEKQWELRQSDVRQSEGRLLDSYVWTGVQAGKLFLHTREHFCTLDLFHPERDEEVPAPPAADGGAADGGAPPALQEFFKDWHPYPRASICLSSTQYLIRNQDLKGIARLTADSIHADDTGDQALPLQCLRLSLAPLRGYERESTAAAEIIDRAADGYVLSTLAGCSLNLPAPAPTLSTHTAARTAVNDLALHMLATARFYEQGIIEDVDPECLHQYRVSLRKLRALLSVLRHVYPADEVKQWRDQLSDIMKGTNQLRDLDVQLEDLQLYTDTIPPEYRKGFKKIAERSRQTRFRQHSQVKDYFESEDYLRRIRTLREELESAHSLPQSNLSSRPIIKVAEELLKSHYKKLTKKAKKLPRLAGHRADEGHHNYEQIHKVRIEGKKLRYLYEFFSPLFSSSRIKPVVKQLKKLQNSLGSYNDLCTQRVFFQQQAKEVQQQGEVDTALAVGGITALIDQKCTLVQAEALERIENFVRLTQEK